MNAYGWDRWLLAAGFACFYLWPLVRELGLWRRERRARASIHPAMRRTGLPIPSDLLEQRQ